MKSLHAILGSLILVSQISAAQDSPLSADPGTPPPPQGWKVGAPENAGIHLPTKSKKQLRMRQGSSSQSTAPTIDAPAAEGEHPVVKTKKTPKAPPPTP